MEPADLIGHYGLDPLNPAGDTYIATGDSGQGAHPELMQGFTAHVIHTSCSTQLLERMLLHIVLTLVAEMRSDEWCRCS
jgi:hypothetical protein